MAEILRHPLTGATYARSGEGIVDVVDGDLHGRFTSTGVWLEGDQFAVDPQMCGWVAGAGTGVEAAKFSRANRVGGGGASR